MDTLVQSPLHRPNPVRNYFTEVKSIIAHPHRFFREMPLDKGLSGPLAFALVTHWLGSALQFLWQSAIGGSFANYFNHFFQVASDVAEVDSPGRTAVMVEMRDRIVHWMWGAGSVLTDPFYTLLSILFTSFFVFLGARILVTPGKNGAPKEITFESAARIVAYGMTPAIFAAVPFLGPVLSAFLIALVTIIGAKVVYGVSYPRAVLVALFPKVLFFGTMLMGFFFLAIFFIKLVTTTF